MSKRLVEWDDTVEEKSRQIHNYLNELFEECIKTGISPEEFHYLVVQETGTIIAKHYIGQRIGKIPKNWKDY